MLPCLGSLVRTSEHDWCWRERELPTKKPTHRYSDYKEILLLICTDVQFMWRIYIYIYTPQKLMFLSSLNVHNFVFLFPLSSWRCKDRKKGFTFSFTHLKTYIWGWFSTSKKRLTNSSHEEGKTTKPNQKKKKSEGDGDHLSLGPLVI